MAAPYFFNKKFEYFIAHFSVIFIAHFSVVLLRFIRFMASSSLSYQLQTDFTPGSGNALQACVASIFQRPLASVPNFIESPEGYAAAIATWASTICGYAFEKIAIDASTRTLARMHREGARVIIRGVSPRGDFGHVVVGRVVRGGRRFCLEHDPHPYVDEGSAEEPPMLRGPLTWAGVFTEQRCSSPRGPRIFDARAVAQRVSMATCVADMERALSALSRGDASMPVRSVTRLPIEGQLGILAAMPCFDGAGGASRDEDVCSCKVITVFPRNSETRGTSNELSAHQGVVLLFSARNGRLLSVTDAHEVTALRTAAASAVATKLLARPSSAAAPAVLAILGTGEQALRHVAAISLVAVVGAVHVWGRDAARATEVAAELAQRYPAIASVSAYATAEAAVADADIVCTLTGAVAAEPPILRGAWLKAGAHVNAVGACTPNHRELDTELVVRARLYVDTRDACLAEPGDLVIPLRDGAIDAQHIVGEIGELINGRCEGRRSAEELTLFKSVGAAVEDLYAAQRVLLGEEEEEEKEEEASAALAAELTDELTDSHYLE